MLGRAGELAGSSVPLFSSLCSTSSRTPVLSPALPGYQLGISIYHHSSFMPVESAVTGYWNQLMGNQPFPLGEEGHRMRFIRVVLPGYRVSAPNSDR